MKDDRLFLAVPEDGPACLGTVDYFYLFEHNKTNTIESKCKFVYRQIEAKEEENQKGTERPIIGDSEEKEAVSKLDENKDGKVRNAWQMEHFCCDEG